MSKQIDRKPGTPAPGGPGKVAVKPQAAKTAPPASGKVTVAPARSGGSRIAQQVTPPKTGFRLRPLDLGLIVLGVVGVAALAWAFLSNNANTAAGTSPTPDPNGSTTRPAGQRTPLPINVAAPDFTLPAADGKTYSLSQFKGNVVLLEFMAPWCPHCQDDSAILDQLYTNYQGKKVQLVSVSASPYGRNYENGDDTPISMDDIIWFQQNFKVPFPMLFDQNVTQADVYGINHYPTIFVLDVRGVINSEPDTPLTLEQLSAALDQALKASNLSQDAVPVAARGGAGRP
ncbi:MAG TPA: TlpA disulfide reductase family protein [Chloroflexia bacterium]|nr:TlpA disulfide reductase family protein [Chloroflexia bacterium]